MSRASFRELHDGDQNKIGGDVGQAAFIVDYPGPSTLTNTAVATATAGEITVTARATATIHIEAGSGGGGNASKFFVVGGNKEYGYTAAGVSTTNGALGSGNDNARGIASNKAGDTYWVIDGDKSVYVYDSAGKSLGSWKPGGLDTPEDITTDGITIWIVDAKKDKVFAYSGAAALRSGSMNATSSFALATGDTNPTGVVTDGSSLWVVDDGSKVDKVFKYSTSGTPLGSWTIDGADSQPRGITIDPNNVGDMWIVDDKANAVFRYAGATARTSGSQSAADQFKLASGNSSPQGIADPPPPGTVVTSVGSSAGSLVSRLDAVRSVVNDVLQLALPVGANTASADGAVSSMSPIKLVPQSATESANGTGKSALQTVPASGSVAIPAAGGVRLTNLDLSLSLDY